MSDTGKTIALIKALAPAPEIDPEQVKQSVEDWLDDHPEATTTVQDGAITKAKLNASLQGTVDDVDALKSQITDIECDAIPRYFGKLYPSNFESGKYIYYVNGNVNSLNGSYASDYFPVYPSSTMTLYEVNHLPHDVDARGLAFYDKAKRFVSGVQYNAGSITGTPQAVTVPATAAFCRITVIEANINDFRVVFDALSGLYDAANSGISDAEVAATPAFEAGKFVYKNGVIGSNASFALSDFLEVSAIDRIHTAYAENYTVAYYNSSKTFISMEVITTSWTVGDIYPNPPENTKYIRYDVYTDLLPAASSYVVYKKGAQYVNDKVDSLVNGSTTSVSLFDNMGVCGDSYTKAQFYKSGTLVGDNGIISWGKILGRMSGIDVSVYASSGADTDTWQERSDCLPALLADSAKRLYVFALGINDYTYVTLGTIADIKEDYTENPNTFYGNWGRIIDQVMAHAPNAKIVLCKCWLVDSVYSNYANDAIAAVASHYSIPFIDPADNAYFKSLAFTGGMDGGHPTPTQQSGMAKAVKELIEKCMEDNTAYFNDYFPA